jgi:hypothetical protein
MNNSLLQAFPVAYLDAARAAVAKSYARLVKAATRAAASVPAEPTLTAVNERNVLRCGSCGAEPAIGTNGSECENCALGVVRNYRVCDVQITCDRAKLAGWDFLAVIEPLGGGNLVNRVPGSDESVDLTAYRTHDGSCDHCQTIRKRNETFVVRSNGDDASIPAGQVKVVGRNCLAAFLGGESPATILWRMTLVKVIGGCAEEGGFGGGGGEIAQDPTEFLAWVSSVIRHDGWVSKGAARAYEEAGGQKTATVSTALYVMTPPWGRDSLKEWKKERERLAPSTDDKSKAEAALAWARGLTGTSDYEYKLNLVAKETSFVSKHAGILGSAVAAYDRFLGKEQERKNRALLNAQSTHLGAVGEKLVVTVTCEGCHSINTDYGALHINRFRDATGNVIIWKTGSVQYDAGKTVTLKGTVKAHDDYKGTKQTVLTRCSEVDPNAPVKVKKPRAKKGTIVTP